MPSPRLWIVPILLALLLVFTGCGSLESTDPWPEPTYFTDLHTTNFTVQGDTEMGGDLDVEGSIYLDGSLVKYDALNQGGYWHEYNLSAISLSRGASGATWVPTDATTLGGYRLDDVTEYLYFTTHIENDLSHPTGARLEVSFEVNVDNTGGADADVVVLDILCRHKLLGEYVNTSVDHTGSTTVGKSDNNQLFTQVIALHSMYADQVNTYRINLDTVASDVDNVIIVYVEMKYQSYFPAQEVD